MDTPKHALRLGDGEGHSATKKCHSLCSIFCHISSKILWAVLIDLVSIVNPVNTVILKE